MNKEIKLTKKLYSIYAKDEWGRLVKDPYHYLEFNTSLRFLRKYLPLKGLVLDAGGGPGRYTIELAQLGYDIILLDLVPENLTVAREQIKKAKIGERVKRVVEGSITDLSEFKDNSFDAVLCLGGPLSHVSPESERQKSILELVRVAKPGAPIFSSVMSKYGVMLSTPGGWPQEVIYKKHYEDLVFKGEDYKFRGNAYCHFFSSDELRTIFSDKGVNILEIIGLEGLNIDKKITNNFARKFPDAWKNWIELHNKICTDPFVVNSSGHMMIVAKKY
ncbi:MAG: class I SAM-dependent methyltransferase [Patescibacteria group bacterium]